MSELRERLMARIPDAWGKWVSCDSGWDWILEDLDSKISYIDPNYQIHQIKEKFGTLRFYCSSVKGSVADSIIMDLTRVAEELSAKTCERCGNSSAHSNTKLGFKIDSTVGLRVNGGWYQTLCKTCGDKEGFILDSDLEEF